MRKGSQITSNYISKIYSDIDSSSISMENGIRNIYNVSNSLYNHSSTIEDILTDNLLNFTNRLKSISFRYDTESSIFTESFESTDFIDKSFSVDNSLTLDTLNRTLTLPEDKAIKNKVQAVIIEPDSNGMEGNSVEGYKNAELSAIFDDSISTIFEYEKFSNVFESSTLDLTITIKLEKYSIINSTYIKLYSPDGIQFPLVELIQISPDGIEWKNINFVIDIENPKSDYYVRFLASPARYMRVKLKQSIAQYVTTGFGLKHRYSIGIRDIQIMTSSFLSNGDYVSVPFSTGSPITKVDFSSDFISNSDINFYISANNGGRWIPIKSGESIELLTKDTGVLMAEDLKTIRVRVGMKRTVSALLATQRQILGVTSSGRYFLSSIPVSWHAYIGGHISFGDIKRYNINAEFPYNIKNEQYKRSGLKFDFSTISFNNNVNIKSTASSADAIQAVKDHIASYPEDYYVVPIKYVPYYDNIDTVIDVMVGNQKINQYYVTGTVGVDAILKPSYLFVRHENSYHSYLYIDLGNIEQFLLVNTDTYIAGTITNSVTIKFKTYNYTPQMSALTGKYIKLPYKSLYRTQENIKIVAVLEDGTSSMLNNKEHYTLLSNSNNEDEIVIDDSIFSTKATYKISYYPSFNIDSFLPDIPASTVQLTAINDADQTSSILFEYTYQDAASAADTKYYSPICKQYTVTLK